MAQISGLWTTDDTTPEGHQQASYTQAHASTMWEIAAACSGKEGVAPNYGNNMSCTTPGVNAVNVNTGGAIVDGKWYKNDAVIALDVDDFPSPSGGTTRIDRIVLRASWAAYTVSVVVIQGTESGGTPVAPSITQTSGTTYDILLYQVLIDSSGNITLTSERTFAIAYVDDSTIEAPGQLRVKNGGITAAKMADGAIDATAKLADSVVTAAKIANRTRKFLVAPHFDGATQAYAARGALLNDGEGNTVHGFFYVPSDYVSGMTIKASVYCSSSGNMYSTHLAYYHAVGEAWNTHSATVAYAAVALTADQRAEVQSLSIASAAAGDYVGVYLIRDATHGSDTLSDDAYIIGFIVEYTADS